MRLNKRMRTDIRMQEIQYRSLRNSQYRFACSITSFARENRINQTGQITVPVLTPVGLPFVIPCLTRNPDRLESIPQREGSFKKVVLLGDRGGC
ncbi:MAG: hypothetical protein ABIL86_10575 [candidate division WOR-3 bacterium]